MQAFISKVVQRKNLITKPKAANITRVIIVSALKEPDLNFEQLDRYIAHSEYHKIIPVLCFNKEDIDDNENLKNEILNNHPSFFIDDFSKVEEIVERYGK